MRLLEANFTLSQQTTVTAVSLRMTEKAGKPYLNCLARKKEVQAKPEEVIRQLWLQRLLVEYGYSASRITVEYPITFGRDSSKRADIVIFDMAAKRYNRKTERTGGFRRMSTITLAVPPDVAARLESDSAARERLEAMAVAMFGALKPREKDEEFRLSPEDMEALRRGAEDSDAGRVSDGRTHIESLKEHIRQRQAAKVANQEAA